MKKIYVVGGANVDMACRSHEEIVPNDSNPGTISYSVGGVAHNIAANLSKMGCNIEYITALAKDAFAEMIRKDCQDNGMSTQYCQEIENASTSLYIAIVQPDGEMNVAVSDMEILSHLDANKVADILSNVNKEDIVVMDTNLTIDQIKTILVSCRGRVFVDPISTTKAKKLSPFLSFVDMVKPNRLEAEALSGVVCRCEDDYRRILNYFLDEGVKQIVISMSENGVIASDGKDYYHIDNTDLEVVNTTGAGDAFMAGYVYGQFNKKSFVESLRYAMAAASIALLSEETVNPNMDEQLLEKYYRKMVKETEVEKI